MNFELAYSRPQKTADRLGPLAEDRHRFLAKSILLTGEDEFFRLQNGRWCLLDSIALSVRICPNVTVVLPEQHADFRREAETLASRIAFGKKVEFLKEIGDFRRFDAVLSIGAKAHPGLPWTTINSNGFIARATSGATDISGKSDVANPIGALGAACLGVGDVFKRLIALKSDRGQLLDGLAFSLLNYRVGAIDPGLQIEATLPQDLLVVGGGAIGNGIAHLISRLPFTREIVIVDREEYGLENLGTCISVAPDEVGKSKAECLAAALRKGGIQARGFFGSFENYAKDLRSYPSVVLNGLDNIDVRHEVQRTLWPDIIIDGAIGDFTCQASRHPWSNDIACLICLFQHPPGRRAEEIQSDATGLPLDRLSDPESPVTQADVDAAPPERQEILRSHVGRPVCSVVQHAVAQQISHHQLESGFEPSVPFIASFSSCMLMTELLIHLSGRASRLEPRFQFDFLLGPAFGLELPQDRRQECICCRRKNIDRIRAARGLSNRSVQ
jgi:molybdopterin/thiamine biosynthesis adenylyltransferase